MKAKEAREFIYSRLDEGVPRKSIYKELLQKIPYKNDVLDIMGNTPDVEAKEKLSRLNVILFCLIVISLFLEVAESYLFFSNLQSKYVYELFVEILTYTFMPIMLISSAVGVKRFEGSMYGMFISFSLLVGMLMRWEVYLNSGIHLFIFFKGSLLVSIILAFYIFKKAFPYYRFLVKLDTRRLEQDLSS